MNFKLFVLAGILFFSLTGCGPSAGERQAISELVEAQKKLASANAEALKQEKIRNEAAAKFSADIELLRKQLVEAQQELANSKSKILALQEDVKRNTPTPTYEVAGEIFIATKGGANFKLGSVNVQVFEKSVVDKFVTEKNTEQAALLKELTAEYDKAKKKWADIIANWSSTYATGDPMVWRAGFAFPTLNKEVNTQNDYLCSLEKRRADLVSGAFFFNDLPKPKISVRSNSEGRFRFSMARDVEVVIAASASRTVGDNIERYFWLVPVTCPNEAATEIALSNNNLSNVEAGGSLILTQD